MFPNDSSLFNEDKGWLVESERQTDRQTASNVKKRCSYRRKYILFWAYLAHDVAYYFNQQGILHC